MKERFSKINMKYSIVAVLLFLILSGAVFAYQNSSFNMAVKNKGPVIKNVVAESATINRKDESDPRSSNVLAAGDADSFGEDGMTAETEDDDSVYAKWLSALIGFEKRDARTLKVPEEYKTIQMAINGARRGDKIEVAEGEYKENIIIKNGIILEGAGADKTILNGDNLGNVVAFKGAYDVKTSLSGFTIKNSGKSLSGILIEDSSPWIHDNVISENEYGIYIKGDSRPAIQKNVISYASKGIQVYNFKSQAEEENNIDGQTAETAKMNADAVINEEINIKTKPNIIDNLITDNKIGIDLYNSAAKIDHNNISYNNHYKTYLGSTFGISFSESSVEISNNIVSDSGICELCAGVSADAESKNVLISYNDIWNNKNDYVCFGECILEDNNISADPLYMDTINGDYKLQAESTLIGKAKDGLDIGIRW